MTYRKTYSYFLTHSLFFYVMRHTVEAGESIGAPKDADPSNLTSSYSLPYSECGGELSVAEDSSGTLASPGYPEQYTHGLLCVWTIKAPAGMRARIYIEDLDLTSTPTCEQDYLLVDVRGKNSSSNDVERLCGDVEDVPREYVSDDNVMVLTLRTSQAGETCRGFKVTYDAQHVVVGCGESVSRRQFVIESPGYPGYLANESLECHLTVTHACDSSEPSSEVCQLRLDFESLTLQPPELGECRLDKLHVQGQSFTPPLCGVNSGQHLYVDVSGRSSTEILLMTAPLLPRPVGRRRDNITGADIGVDRWEYEVENNRQWRIRVAQIPCSCEAVTPGKPRAPDGCSQYYTQVTDVVRSFNFDGKKRDLEPCWNGTEEECGRQVWTGHLNHVHHTICIARQPGYCGVMYAPTDADAFLMTGHAHAAAGFNRKNLYGSSQCQSDYVVIPKGRTPGDEDSCPHDRFCGLQFGNRLLGPVVSYSLPFMLTVHTDEDEFSHSVDTNNRGFELRYTQLPCAGPNMG
ncbi:cubilin [Hyalella azteca]|uniref:Cubilin n=1 Tax=Hyalella azteca TaxID=294128 RepID=A0A8B7PM59_HYAAZ|nr:cubilin [Hyalella azteca]